MNNRKFLAGAVLLGASAMSSMAVGPDVTDILTAASTTFASVAALCITFATFWIGYRLVKRIK